MSVNMFKPRKFEDHEIADGNGSKGGDIRVKPSGIVRYRGGIMNIHRMVLIAATAFLITSGTLDAQNVIAENADISASSSGDVSLAVSNSLKASASSSGSIDISRKGNVNVLSQKESSGGSISIK